MTKIAAEKLNDVESQFFLGQIYSDGHYVPIDIRKAIHYYVLASNQNDSRAQNNLGSIYSEGILIQKDINKAIHYFTLSAENNCKSALFNLSMIYRFHIADFEKEYLYLSRAAKLNHPKSNYVLGEIYLKGRNVPKDKNKALFYFNRAAQLKEPNSQYNLGLIYLKENDIPKAVNYLTLSSMNGIVDSSFILVFLYQEGKVVDEDIIKSIHFYKEASSFNNQYAKNNLGILYKNGFGEFVRPNLGTAIEYFKEAIQQNKDVLPAYNLAHLYLYSMADDDSIMKAIELLVNFLKPEDWYQCFLLLFVALNVKFNFDYCAIINEIPKICKSKDMEIITRNMIDYYRYSNFYEKEYDKLKKIDYIYNNDKEYIITRNSNKKVERNLQIPDINSFFYDGFSIQK